MLPGSQFVNETPDVFRWGPLLFGLLNEPVDADVKQGGPIVMNWSFRFKAGKEQQAKAIIHETIQYYSEIGEYGSILLNFRFEEFYGGYTVIQVFKDAASFEKHLSNTKKAPFYSDIVALNGMIE